jgi:hypothetical protein
MNDVFTDMQYMNQHPSEFYCKGLAVLRKDCSRRTTVEPVIKSVVGATNHDIAVGVLLYI